MQQAAEGNRLRNRLRPLQHLDAGQILVHEIFASVQGESSHAGRPCTFVRTTACNLRCSYCDTRHAFARGRPMAAEAVLAEVCRLGVALVEVTGGEPLLQAPVLPLMARMCDLGYTVMCETSGSISVADLDPRVIKVLDLKTPSSGEHRANLLSNLYHLTARDEVKFVLGSRDDYLWARELICREKLADRCTVLMGPVWDALPPAELVAWMLADRLPVRLQLQLHKFIWDPKATGV